MMMVYGVWCLYSILSWNFYVSSTFIFLMVSNIILLGLFLYCCKRMSEKSVGLVFAH